MYSKIILFILLPIFAFSQAPQKINFQSILRNSSGEVVANKNVKLKISIQSGSMMDTTVYSETHLKTTDVSGLMSIKIGTGTVIMGRFDSIKWGKAPHFIKLEADFNGGNSFVLLGTQELMSVPYAFHSNTADSLVGGISLKDIKDELAFLTDIVNILYRQTPLTDIDGNIYDKIIIGNQVWMAENLRVSRYRNGDPIPIVTDNSDWNNSTTGARCWFNNDSITYENPYGNLYNWYAASDSRGICPIGWHVPTDAEWLTLSNNLGGEVVAGGKLKSTSSLWLVSSPPSPGTNASGFSGLPSGWRGYFEGYLHIGYFAYYWSASEFNINDGIGRALFHDINQFGAGGGYFWRKVEGGSIRCLKD